MAAKDSNAGRKPPEQKSWRGKPRQTVPSASRRWQLGWGRQQRQEVSGKNLRRRLWLGLTSSGALALLCYFLYLVFFAPRPAPLVALAITSYAAPLPPNAWAREDVERFQAPAPGLARRNLRVQPVAAEWDTPEAALDDLRQQLKVVKPGGPRRNVVLVYLSAHGVVDDMGEPCLVLAEKESPGGEPGARPPHLDTRRWLPLKRLVAELDGLAKGAKKVLILDANRMHANWGLGLLYNAFAERLPDVLRDRPDIVILNSTGPGQVGWASGQLGSSAFGYFVARGLRGYDDSDANGDGRVSLRELRDYLQGKVSHWALQNRFDVQEPLLVPADAEDFDLVDIEEEPAAAKQGPLAGQVEAGEAAADGSANRLAALWKTHEQYRPWNGETPSPTFPRERMLDWLQFGADLVRAEQLLSSGKAYRPLAAAAVSKLEEDAKSLAAPGQRATLAAHSLPLARARMPQGAELETQRKTLASRLAATTPPPPGPEKYDYLARADAAWSFALGLKNAEAVALSRAMALAGEPPEGFGPEVVELRFLRLLGGKENLPGGIWPDAAADVDLTLECRDRAEQAAAPGDERAQYAVRALVAQADDERRRAEDALFVGRAEDLTAARAGRQAAAEGYERALAQATTVTNAFAARDRAWADLPYLAQWLARRTSPDESSRETIQKLDAQLALLVDVAHQAQALAGELDALVGESLGEAEVDAGRIARVEETTKNVTGGLKLLNADLRDHVEDISTREKDQSTLRDIEALLAVPLVSGEDRLHLQDIYRQAAERTAQSRVAGAQRESQPADPTLYLRRATKVWPEQPALALLSASEAKAAERKPAAAQPEEPSGAAPLEAGPLGPEQVDQAIKKLCAAGKQLRDRLSQVDAQVREWLSTSSAPADAKPAISNARENYSRADQLARAAVPLAGGAAIVSENPVGRLAAFDLSQLLLFEAGRALDDFWGPAAPASQPYFVEVCESYRKAARQLRPAEDPAWRQQGELLARRKQAAKEVVSPTTDNQLSLVDEGNLKRSVELQRAADLPPGEAALYVVDAARRSVGAKQGNEREFQDRLGIEVPAATKAPKPDNLELMLRAAGPPSNENATAAAPWEIVGFYRGHRRVAPFHVSPRGRGIELVSHFPTWNNAQVVVLGEAKSPGTVVFVLDCSSSMAEPNNTRERMNAARGALIGILKQLAEVGQYKVGLWLYGHRVGVNGMTRIADSWNPAWGPRDPGLLPSDDVQRVLEPRTLDRRSLRDFLALLEDQRRVNAWGRTPLYRAIVDAVAGDLARLPDGSPRRLVVITDGEDEVTAQGDQWQPKPGSLRSEADVVRAFARDGGRRLEDRIQLDVVGVNLGAEAKLAGLVRSPDIGGRYHPISDLTTLSQEIADSLGLYHYTVKETRPGGRLLGERLIGKSLEIVDRDLLGQKFDVRVPGTKIPVRSQVALEGAEALELFLERRDGEWRLIERRYDRDGETADSYAGNRNPAADGSDPDFHPGAFYVAAHTPQIGNAGAVNFPISIQNDDEERFSPRPAEAWVEITPMFADPPPEGVFRYPIYDLSFEEKRPVPVLFCAAPQWPREARAAEIRLWFKLAKTRPTKEALVGEVARDDQRANPALAVEGLPGVEFAVQTGPVAGGEGTVITVVERHPPGAQGLGTVKVEMLEPPDEARHEYFPEGRFVRHRFVYGQIRDEAAVQHFHLRLTSRQDLENEAVTLARPLKVEILEHSLATP